MFFVEAILGHLSNGPVPPGSRTRFGTLLAALLVDMQQLKIELPDLRGDRDEPQHIHVERDENVAKFWLIPIRLQSTGGLTSVVFNNYKLFWPCSSGNPVP
jgi:hypothetical protein